MLTLARLAWNYYHRREGFLLIILELIPDRQPLMTVAILSRAALIMSDVVVLLVTWWQVWTTARSSGQRWTQSALAILLLRDSKPRLSIVRVAELITLGSKALHISCIASHCLSMPLATDVCESRLFLLLNVAQILAQLMLGNVCFSDEYHYALR